MWKHLRYRTNERWLDGRGREFLPVHALLRRRQHEVLGQRALPPAPRGLPGDRARGRHLAGVADRLRHAGAVLRSRRAALSRARPARRGPDRAAAGAISAPRRAARGRNGGHRRASCGEGLHPSPLPLGLHASRRGGRLRALQHLQLVRVQGAREERGGRVLRAAGDRSGRTSTLWTNARARRLITDRGGTRVEAVEIERDGETHPRRRAAVRRVVRRGQLRGAAAAIGQRRASARPRELVGAGRPPLHGAPRDDDAGLPSAAEERRPSFRRPSRSTITTCAGPTRRIRSARSSRRGARTASWRRPSCRGSRCGRTTPGSSRGVDWLVMSEDLPAQDNRVTVDAGRADPAALPPEQPRGAHAKLVQGDHAHPAAAWASGGRGALAQSKNTTHQCGTLVLRHRPARVGARPVLPDPRRREPLRRRRVVLPVVGRGEPRPDDRGAGAARGGPHQGRRISCVRWSSDESALVQPRRHHGVGLQQGGAVLLGGVRLPAGRRRRHAARSRPQLLRRRRRRSPRCKIGWIRAPGGAVLEIFEFQPQQPPVRSRGTGSA